MADVVRLEERLIRTPRRPAAEPREGKILFFTGVRYERFAPEDDHHKGPVRRNGSGKKKH